MECLPAQLCLPPPSSQLHSKIENKPIIYLICCSFKAQRNCGSSVGVVIKLRAAQSREFDSQQRHEILVFSRSSKPTVEPTQTSVQRYRVSFPGVKLPHISNTCLQAWIVRTYKQKARNGTKCRRNQATVWRSVFSSVWCRIVWHLPTFQFNFLLPT